MSRKLTSICFDCPLAPLLMRLDTKFRLSVQKLALSIASFHDNLEQNIRNDEAQRAAYRLFDTSMRQCKSNHKHYNFGAPSTSDLVRPCIEKLFENLVWPLAHAPHARLAPSLFRQWQKLGKGKLAKGVAKCFVVHCFRQTYYGWRNRRWAS